MKRIRKRRDVASWNRYRNAKYAFKSRFACRLFHRNVNCACRGGWQYEWCRRCDTRNVIGFSVSDDVWERVIRGRWNVVCPPCFDVEAQLAGVVYTFEAVYPVTWSD